MFGKIKDKLRKRHEAKLRDMFIDKLKAADLQYQLHRLPVPCEVHGNHDVLMICALAPAGIPDLYVNMQTAWRSDRVLMQVGMAETWEEFVHEAPIMVRPFKRKQVAHQLDHFVEDLQLHWIESRL